MKPDSIVVKYRTVAITLFPWSPRSGVVYWKFRHGKKHIVRSTLEKARAEAKRIAEETFLGTARLGALTTAQTQAIRRMLAVDPQLTLVDDFLSWHRIRKPRKNCQEAIAAFLDVKKANAGRSNLHVGTLAKHLAALPKLDLCDIGPNDLPALAGVARTRRNRRSAWVTFFRWCVAMGYLPHGEPTAPEKLEVPRVTRGIPVTWTPQELRVLLTNVRASYLPWLVLGAFAGIRTEEICPQHGSRKSPLMWEDFQWERGLIVLRPETAKTGHRRIIPINAAIKAWLPIQREGRVGPQVHPSKPSTAGATAETTRLGLLLGGWKRNALRHSFLSYRSAEVGIAQTAMEAGNSETEARRSYIDAMGADHAAAWFAVLPQEYPRSPHLHVLPKTETPVESKKKKNESI
jgi:integrase